MGCGRAAEQIKQEEKAAEEAKKSRTGPKDKRNASWRPERWRYSGKTEMRCHTLPHRRGFIFLLFYFLIPPFHLITSYLALTRHSKKKAPKCRSFIDFLLFYFFYSLASFFHVITHSPFQEENQHFFSGREDKIGNETSKIG